MCFLLCFLKNEQKLEKSSSVALQVTPAGDKASCMASVVSAVNRIHEKNDSKSKLEVWYLHYHYQSCLTGRWMWLGNVGLTGKNVIVFEVSCLHSRVLIRHCRPMCYMLFEVVCPLYKPLYYKAVWLQFKVNSLCFSYKIGELVCFERIIHCRPICIGLNS